MHDHFSFTSISTADCFEAPKIFTRITQMGSNGSIRSPRSPLKANSSQPIANSQFPTSNADDFGQFLHGRRGFLNRGTLVQSQFDLDDLLDPVFSELDRNPYI